MKKSILLLLFAIGLWPCFQNGEFIFFQTNLLIAQSFGSESGSNTKSGSAECISLSIKGGQNASAPSQCPGTDFTYTFIMVPVGNSSPMKVTKSIQKGASYFTSISDISALIANTENSVTIKGKYPSTNDALVIWFSWFSPCNNEAFTISLSLAFTPLSCKPAAPTNLNYSLYPFPNTPGKKSVNLYWTAPLGQVDGYYIYSQSGKSNYKHTSTSALGMWVNPDLGAKTTYSVVAFNASGESPQSNVVTIIANPLPTITLNDPPAPTAGDRFAHLSWTCSNSSITSFNVHKMVGTIKITTIPVTGNTMNYFVQICDEFMVSAVLEGVEITSNTVMFCVNKADLPPMYSASSNMLKSAGNKEIIEVDDISPENVIIYPNPVKDKLCIEGIYDFEAIIFDLSSKKLLHFMNVNASIDLSELSRGTYIVQIKNDKINMTRKIIKQ